MLYIIQLFNIQYHLNTIQYILEILDIIYVYSDLYYMLYIVFKCPSFIASRAMRRPTPMSAMTVPIRNLPPEWLLYESKIGTP